MRILAYSLLAALCVPAAAQQDTDPIAEDHRTAPERAGDAVGDALLELEVKSMLLKRLGSEAFRIEVEVENHAASLSGEVRTVTALEMAPQWTAKVGGIETVRSDLKISAPEPDAPPPAEPAEDKGTGRRAGEAVDDAVLETKVKSRLLTKIGFNAFRIEVESVQRVVTLTGTVPDPETRALAVKHARATRGVQSVIDKTELRGNPSE